MWSWHYNKQPENNKNHNSFINTLVKKNIDRTIKPKSNFNVRNQYAFYKENHPYFEELYKPQQSSIKLSYL